MNTRHLTDLLLSTAQDKKLAIAGDDARFYTRLSLGAGNIHTLYSQLYADHPAHEAAFGQLIEVVVEAHRARSADLRKRDAEKSADWFLSNELAGMSLYVDRFCGGLTQLPDRLDYLLNLGVNTLHLMPLFESPPAESDGGYAVSDFRKVDDRFGTLDDLKKARRAMGKKKMYLMLDIVLNHTSRQHEWAQKARAGDPTYQDYFYFFDNRDLPDRYEQTMPEVFPTAAPGNFTWVEECQKWVMTVFHTYQWDLNYRNPRVFVAMLDTVLFYANLGVDILRIDAPAFLWKEPGTTCQNLPQAHQILQLLKKCVEAAAPGMALLGEAIVDPYNIMKYFGEGRYLAQECDFAYNATQMALQWDALASGQTTVMRAAQPILSQKPLGTSWITYTRCHDDIGLGYDDYMIEAAGYTPYLHRRYLKEYLSGAFPGSPARGALFSVNPKTQDARISGTLASLCGLEKAMEENDEHQIALSVQKILLMQAHSFFLGGLPMLFYGDEAAYLNDYSYQELPEKSYDNRWMHRPLIDWDKNARTSQPGTIEHRVYAGTQRLLSLRRKLPVLSDRKNTHWLPVYSPQIAAFTRNNPFTRMYCLFNYSADPVQFAWHSLRDPGHAPTGRLYDHWSQEIFSPGSGESFLEFAPYGFFIFEEVE